ncbi:hypothetical protein [Streptomyces sp. NBRC 109706]|uniref:hypothetical protein n=1 Tax=Streptomyces sp. NBRC 109706 TaxID=1550035 RepID=UPI00131DB9D1|nr:hypothetical protein [Streptomyces sp. NBRC 109706]
MPELIPMGPVLLPEFFHLVIGTEDSWYTHRSSPTENPSGGECTLFLNFQIFEGEIMMSEARAAYDDIPRVLERVRKVIRPDKWRRLGIHCMTQYLLRFMEEGGRPSDDPMIHGWPADSGKTAEAYGWYRPKSAVDWLERLQEHASDAYAQARDAPSPRRRRNRITDDFLRGVAQTYRMAENMGAPPTREVANHFKAPHSTAAKWVSAARRKKYLPPVAGSSSAQRLTEKEMKRISRKPEKTEDER